MPENYFVTVVIENISKRIVRVTTACSIDDLRSRGRGGTSAPRVAQVADEGNDSRGRGRTSAPGTTHVAYEGNIIRGRRNGKKISAEASTSGTTHVPNTTDPGRGREHQGEDHITHVLVVLTIFLW